jgi:hypothetical protein
MDGQDSLYRVLGLSGATGAQEIHAAYRAAARRCHPDASGDPSTGPAMARINEAYEALRAIWCLPPIGDLMIAGPRPELGLALTPHSAPPTDNMASRHASECYRAIAISPSAGRLDLRA